MDGLDSSSEALSKDLGFVQVRQLSLLLLLLLLLTGPLAYYSLVARKSYTKNSKHGTWCRLA